jgi:site-specific recombinase XerD
VSSVRRTAPTLPDLAVLLDSWVLTLRAERKAKGTLEAYVGGVRKFLAWCDAKGRAAVLDRPTVQAFMADLLDLGHEPATVTSRQLALRRFSAWLADEGEIDHDELVGLKPPKLDTKIVQPLTDGQLRALLKVCEGREFRDVRDTALVRLMVETGARAGEVVAMELADVDLLGGTAVIRRGKGGKGRAVPFGPHTAKALDRYIRARRLHRLASTSALWLGDGGKTFGYEGLHKVLSARARSAGIDGFKPHLLRHTFASRWLGAGGTEQGLMAVAGWSKHDLLQRYTRATASERAAEEARRLNLGDL